MAEYSTTFASLRAASISSGVIATGSGAAALRGAANAVSPSAAEPLITSRRDGFCFFIASSCSLRYGAGEHALGEALRPWERRLPRP